MIICGIDPGLAISGYGIINYVGNRFQLLEYGTIDTEAGLEFPLRLKKIYDSYVNIFNKYNPEAIAIEELFFNKNVKTAITVGQARGVHILAAVNNNIDLYEYTPLQIKQGIVGYGRADKRQVQEMVKIILKMESIPKPDDAADGIAVAICHAHSLKYANNFKIK